MSTCFWSSVPNVTTPTIDGDPEGLAEGVGLAEGLGVGAVGDGEAVGDGAAVGAEAQPANSAHTAMATAAVHPRFKVVMAAMLGGWRSGGATQGVTDRESKGLPAVPRHR